MASIRSGLLLVLCLTAPLNAAAAGLTDIPSWIHDGKQTNAGLGTALAGAGDINADGFDDVLVAAPDFSDRKLEVGRVLLFLGSAMGLSADVAWTRTGTQAYGHLGAELSGAGDVNGDGYDDVLVTTPDHSNSIVGIGRAQLFRGGPDGLSNTASWTLEGIQEAEHLGIGVAGGGDVNGDGYDDVLVGAPHHSTTLSGAGRVMLFLGSPGGLSATPIWELPGDQTAMNFGVDVDFAGDVNADGFDEIIVGASTYSNGESKEGAAFLFYGCASGIASTTPWADEGNQELASYGHAVAGAGDVDDDGFDDVLIGAWAYDRLEEDQGRAYLYRGSSTGLSDSASWIGEIDHWKASFGFAVAGAGDVDADGYDDLLIGAFRYDHPLRDEGGAFLFRGDVGNPPPSADWMKNGGQVDALMGYAVAAAGDVNGDGAADVLVGAPDFDGDFPDGGRVYLYRGVARATAAQASTRGPSLTLAAPSPFPAHGRLLYSIPHGGRARLVIFDARGRRVRDLLDRTEATGDHFVRWNGRDFTARRVAAGLYFARLRFGDEERVTKIVMLRGGN